MSGINIQCIKHKTLWLFLIIAIAIIIAFSFAKYRSGEVGYYNADATWHTLYTIQAYDETPISVHKFLPIVTLGQTDDKNIPWGSTIPDEQGNYYYTSFSWIGYVLPWAFFKVFGLPVSEGSLYLFNTILYILASITWLSFIYIFYEKNKNRNLYLFLAMLSTIFMPELMHGMGMVFWHQSVLQVLLPLQLTAYYLWKNRGSLHAKRLFFALTLLNPWIEWTGYVANIGYVVMEFFVHRKTEPRDAQKNILWIIGLSAAAFLLFSIHYIWVISLDKYFITIFKRFYVRSVASGAVSKTLRLELLTGYIHSFLFWWVLLSVLFIGTLVKNKKVELRHGSVLLLLAFPCLENILMQEHAISYSYDRMKMVYLLSFVTCELFDQFMDGIDKQFRIRLFMAVAAIFTSGLNVVYYLHTTDYRWKTDYRQNNKIFADYIHENYQNNVLGTNRPVRGYINLLFHRGIYEKKKIEELLSIAKEKNKQYAVYLHFDGDATWNFHAVTVRTSEADWGIVELHQVDVYDLQNHATYTLSLDSDGKIISQRQ